MSNNLYTANLEERIEELESELEDIIDIEDEEARAAAILLVNMKEEWEEYEELEALRDEIGDHCEWAGGMELIQAGNFPGYVEDMCVDCGYISKDMPGFIEIDWKKTAENVEQDYSTVDFRGTTYYYRDC